mmetsp:Transcript_49286/g.127880  ORF Transcript_49286/g.127880 Transcript_49286/m.127880 type:complete len:338 (-) Transcript_49286:770-1783(-)
MPSMSCLCRWASSARWRSILRMSSLLLPMSTSCAAVLTVRLFTSSRSFPWSRFSSPEEPWRPLMRRSRALSRLFTAWATVAWCLSRLSTRSVASLWRSSSCFAESAACFLIIASVSDIFWSILFWISLWTSACFEASASKRYCPSFSSSKRRSVAALVACICFRMLSKFDCTLPAKRLLSARSWLVSSSTFRRRVSVSSRRPETMSRTVLIDASMSSFISFQVVMSTLASIFDWFASRKSAMSSESWWQRSCASCKLCDTSSIQASWAFRASCMSPMSRRMVEISAVTVASTRCLEVMIECVESTRARISSRSTFTASMAAVKSSMSRSQASTMRLT